jgi:hypothetical protein
MTRSTSAERVVGSGIGAPAAGGLGWRPASVARLRAVGQSAVRRAGAAAHMTLERANWRYLILVIGLLGFMLALVQAKLPDWSTYMGALERVSHRQALYPLFETSGPFVLDQASQGRGFVYPPTAMPLLLVLSFLGSGHLYGILASAWLIAVVVLIVRRAGYSTAAQALVAGLFLISYPLADGVGSGQITILLAAALGSVWLAPRSSGWLALLGLVKIYPAALASWGLRRHAPLIGPPVAAALLVAVTTLWLGSGVWGDYLQVALNGGPACQIMSAMSLRCATGSMLPGYVVAAMLLAGSLFVRPAAGLAMLALAMVLAAPDFWPHYLLITMVGFLPFALQLMLRHPTSARASADRAPSSPPRSPAGSRAG